jgi:hypothetical protein
MAARDRQRLNLRVVLVEEVSARPIRAVEPLLEEVQDVFGYGVGLRRVSGCCRQIELQSNGSGKRAALCALHLLGNRSLEPVTVTTRHLLRLRLDFINVDMDDTTLPPPVTGKRTPLALQKLVECVHVGFLLVGGDRPNDRTGQSTATGSPPQSGKGERPPQPTRRRRASGSSRRRSLHLPHRWQRAADRPTDGHSAPSSSRSCGRAARR